MASVVNLKPVHLAVAAGAVVLAYVWLRGARGAASSVAEGAGNAFGGLVEGLGLGLGLPTTDAGKCAAAKASGDLLGTSVYCTAPDFFGSLGSTAKAAGQEAIFGVGDAVGLPRPQKTACQQRIEEFRALPWYEQALKSFEVSAACEVGDYLKFIATGKGPMD